MTRVKSMVGLAPPGGLNGLANVRVTLTEQMLLQSAVSHVLRRLVSIRTARSPGARGIDAVLNGQVLHAGHQWSRGSIAGRQTPQRDIAI